MPFPGMSSCHFHVWVTCRSLGNSLGASIPTKRAYIFHFLWNMLTCKMPLEAQVGLLRASRFALIDSTAPPIPILPGISPRTGLAVLFANSPRNGPILSRSLVSLVGRATAYYPSSLVTSVCCSIPIVPIILIFIFTSPVGFISCMGFNPTSLLAVWAATGGPFRAPASLHMTRALILGQFGS